MMVLCLCMAMVTPVLSFGAYAEGGTVVEVLDENGQITEMGDGDAQVILEDPALIEDDPVDEDTGEIQEEEQMRNAERDDLTGLLTRKATMQLIRHSLENSLLYDRHALLMIDMDHFKAINDTYGHPAGDQALVDTANVIRENFRSSDIVGRIGGDEFFVLMTHVPDRATVEKKAISLVEKLNRVHYADIYLSASVGISVYPEDAGDLDNMYSKADKAMYEAKKARNAYVFAEDMTSEASK